MQVARLDPDGRNRLIDSLVDRCAGRLTLAAGRGGPPPDQHLAELRRSWLRRVRRGAIADRGVEIDRAIACVDGRLTVGGSTRSSAGRRADTQLAVDLLSLDRALAHAVRLPR